MKLGNDLPDVRRLRIDLGCLVCVEGADAPDPASSEEAPALAPDAEDVADPPLSDIFRFIIPGHNLEFFGCCFRFFYPLLTSLLLALPLLSSRQVME